MADTVRPNYTSWLPVGFVWEVNGSRSEQWAKEKFTASISYICEWKHRAMVMQRASRSIYQPMFNSVDEDAFFFSTYYPPICSSLSSKPLGAEGQTPPVGWNQSSNLVWQPHTMCQIDASYEGVARFNGAVQQTVTPSIGMRTLPSWGYYWHSDGSPVLDKEAPAAMSFSLKISRTLSGVRRIPRWFFLLAGKCNSNVWSDIISAQIKIDPLTGKPVYDSDGEPVYVPSFVAQPGQLLFNPVSMDRQINLTDDPTVSSQWNLQFELNWNPIGWNNFQRPHGVDRIMYKGAPYWLYTPAPFPVLTFDSRPDQGLHEGGPLDGLPVAGPLAEDQMMGDDYIVRTFRYNPDYDPKAKTGNGTYFWLYRNIFVSLRKLVVDTYLTNAVVDDALFIGSNVFTWDKLPIVLES